MNEAEHPTEETLIMGIRDKIAAIVDSPEIADRILELFDPIYSYETPALDDPVLQPQAPGVMYSYRTVRWESPTEPAPNEPTPAQPTNPADADNDGADNDGADNDGADSDGADSDDRDGEDDGGGRDDPAT